MVGMYHRLLGGTERQAEDKKRGRNEGGIILWGLAVKFITASPVGSGAYLEESESHGVWQTRDDMLCILEMWFGLGHLISHPHPTVPFLALLYDKLLKEVAVSLYFFTVHSIVFHSNLVSVPISVKCFVRITKCHSNGLSFVFIFLDFLAIFHVVFISLPDNTSLPTLTACSSPPTAQAFASLISLPVFLLPDFWMEEGSNAQSWTPFCHTENTSLGDFISNLDFKFHLYIDESQIYVSSPYTYVEFQTRPSHCLLNIFLWMRNRHQNRVLDSISFSFIPLVFWYSVCQKRTLLPTWLFNPQT